MKYWQKLNLSWMRLEEVGDYWLSVKIELEFDDNLQATRVLDAVAPDNSPLPSGIAITTKIIENKLVIHIDCERSIDSLRATVEDIMSAIDLSVRTIQSVENDFK